MTARMWFWASVVLAGTAAPVAAQAPSPLELARGIREAGMPDLALEYLKEIEGKPLSPPDKQALILERAKCLLEAAEDEPDEGTRTSMIGEAKQGFNSFLATAANHPRAAEGSLALARLTSVEAKAQLNRARRMELPAPDEPGYDAARSKQAEEAKKAQPLFNRASKLFGDAAEKIKAKLNEPGLDPATRQVLTREAFDAELLAAINKYNLADTFILAGAKETVTRDKYLEEARASFEKLAQGPPTSRNVYIARAWMAEILAEQGKPNDAAAEFAEILKTPRPEAEDGKRLVRFFQIRRNYLAALTEGPARLKASENELRAWLARYGNTRKPTAEELAARYYLAFALQLQAQALSPPAKDGKPTPLSPTARGYLQEAERIYRVLTQSDNDYTVRATRNRLAVVRRLLGEADASPSSYLTFEDAQMAALIQMGKMFDAEKSLAAAKNNPDDSGPFWAALIRATTVPRLEREIRDRKLRIIALLERARELASDKDTPGDVTDNLLRLVYFYNATDQPHQAAVLGEHIARTVKSTGGKSAAAGLMALNGYLQAAASIKADPTDEQASAAAQELRKVDRERAIAVARLLDEKYPNDTATDAARHRLALLLLDDGQHDQAFEAIIKIRPGYTALHSARQLQGFIAQTLITKEGVPPERKKAVFQRTVADLSKLTKPTPDSLKDEVRGYISTRVRLAQLYLAQSRADPESEAKTRGYDQALTIADEVLAQIPAFAALSDKDNKLKLPDGLNLDGLELKYLALDIRTRALYVRCKMLIDTKDLGQAAQAIEPVVQDVARGPLFDDRMKQWAGGQGEPGDEEDVITQKTKTAGLAAGIDRTRRDVVMVGFKLQCILGKPDEAKKMLELLKAAGGGVEANQSTLELMARELAAQIPELRKQNLNTDADQLGAGLALLLNEFTALKELPSTTVLFLGQTFFTVGKYDEALREFAKIPPPSAPDWASRKIEEFPPDVRGTLSKEIREYRFAQLYIAKCLRSAKRFDEAEKHILRIMGSPEKPGWGYSSLDFRKELATLYENKAASLTDIKAANAEWVKAQKEWTTLFSIHRTLASKITPDTPREEARQTRSNFFDAYFELQRVLVTANQQLVKDPVKLNATFEKVGQSIANMERTNQIAELDKKGEGIITPQVAYRFWELLEQQPAVKNAYKAAGGKFFLDKPKLD